MIQTLILLFEPNNTRILRAEVKFKLKFQTLGELKMTQKDYIDQRPQIQISTNQEGRKLDFTQRIKETEMQYRNMIYYN